MRLKTKQKAEKNKSTDGKHVKKLFGTIFKCFKQRKVCYKVSFFYNNAKHLNIIRRIMEKYSCLQTIVLFKGLWHEIVT